MYPGCTKVCGLYSRCTKVCGLYVHVPQEFLWLTTPVTYTFSGEAQTSTCTCMYRTFMRWSYVLGAYEPQTGSLRCRIIGKQEAMKERWPSLWEWASCSDAACSVPFRSVLSQFWVTLRPLFPLSLAVAGSTLTVGIPATARLSLLYISSVVHSRWCFHH